MVGHGQLDDQDGAERANGYDHLAGVDGEIGSRPPFAATLPRAQNPAWSAPLRVPPRSIRCSISAQTLGAPPHPRNIGKPQSLTTRGASNIATKDRGLPQPGAAPNLGDMAERVRRLRARVFFAGGRRETTGARRQASGLQLARVRLRNEKIRLWLQRAPAALPPAGSPHVCARDAPPVPARTGAFHDQEEARGEATARPSA